MLTKKLVGVSLFIFWAVVVAILVAWLLSYQKNTTINPSIAMNNSTPVVLTASEVAKHKTGKDCWMIVGDKIYNVAPYIGAHQGGATTIINSCGKDATIAFNTQGGQGNHSSNARNLLQNFYIGDVGKTVSAEQLNNTVFKIQSNPLPAKSSRNEDD